MSNDDFDHEDVWRFYGVIQTREMKPILAQDELRQTILDVMNAEIVAHDSQLWGYVILPDSIQLVVEVPTENTYHVLMEAIKSAAEQQVIDIILSRFQDLLDMITYYNPARTQPTYLVWQGGYHTQLLSSIYSLSNKIAYLVQRPVTLGLVDRPEAWAFSSFKPQDVENDEDS